MKLKELGTIVTGNTPSKSNVEFYNSNDINFYKPSDFIENELNVLDSSEEYISNSAKSKARMIPKNSVMMTCIGTIGKIGITTKESTCNQQINAIVANEMVDSKYLGYKLLSIKDLLIKKANAPVVPILNKTDFSNIEISIHEKNEQLRIVSKLDKLNILLKLKKEEIEKCNQLIKSQFVEMFETETNIKTLDDVCKKITDGSHNPPKGVNYETEYLMLSSQNINGGRINFNNPRYLTKENFDFEHKRTNIEKGDILLTIVGTVGRTAIVNDEKVTLQRSVAVLKLTELVNSYFMSYSFQNEFVSSQLVKGAKGVAQKGIYLGDLKKLNLKVPPIELQNKFAQIVEQIDKQKFELENSLKKLEELQASLMQEYFG